MSLFPAYSSREGDGNSKENLEKIDVVPQENWLENASFAIEVSQIPLPEILQPPRAPTPELIVIKDEVHSPPPPRILEPIPVKEPVIKAEKRKRPRSEDREREHKSSRSKRSKKSKKNTHHKSKSSRENDATRTTVTAPPTTETGYFEDKKAERGNLTVPTLSRPAIPFYRVERYYRVLGSFQLTRDYHNRSKKRKSSKKANNADRYFKHPLEECVADQACDGLNSEIAVESELSKKTAEFNKILGETPHNIEKWLEYIRFQDTVCQFERTYRKGGGAQGIRVTAERKLAMIDKALSQNFDSEVLLQERCNLVEVVFPADEASKQFTDMIEKRPKSMAMWQGLIGANQFSMSLCTAARVFELYERGMSRFHQLRRGAPASQVKPAEENILELLLQCGLFLRQAGLHEQLWTLLKLYLELNFALPNIQLTSTVSEKKLIETEEVILASNLPLPELWVRVETLRESCHWLPWDSSADCEDPQRVVFTDDVSNMLHPITTPDLSFRLATIVMTLMKVPFLPCRDTSLHWLGLSRITSLIDSVEILLTTLFSVGIISPDVSEMLSEAADLVAGPSYLLPESRSSLLIGNESYLDFVTKTFHLCAEGLAEPKRTALYVWWLRFERFLIILAESKVCKQLNKKKKVKSTIKDFLKQEKNRNNLLFYREYALIEREFGNVEGACGILMTTIMSQHCSEPVIGIANAEDKSRLCCLYRTIAELLLASKVPDRKLQALNLLVSLGLGLSPPNLSTHKFTLQDQANATAKFQHITTELLNEVDGEDLADVDGTEHLLPDFVVDWVCCTAWILYLTKSTWDAATFLEDALAKFPARIPEEKVVTKIHCRREALFENYISLLHCHCHESTGSFMPLQGVMQRALKEFPNNMHFLATTVKGESVDGRPWWDLKRFLEETNSQAARIFLVFLAKDRQRQQERRQLIEQNCELNPAPSLAVSDAGYKNRASALFRQLTAHPTTRRCPLVWRLYLKFLFSYGSRDLCRATFFRAVEEIPWIKALYLDGAKMLPAEIQQVQDLLIEKELRLHVTPEELEILRIPNEPLILPDAR